MARAGGERAAHFILIDGDRILLADFCQNEAELHATLRDGAVLRFQLFFGLAFVFRTRTLALQFRLHLPPDHLEFRIDHSLREIEAMGNVERIQDPPL